MRWAGVLAGAMTLGTAMGALPRTVSTSRQFIVFGEDARLRGSVADLAEATKFALLSLLQVPDRWSVPILLNLGQPQANVPEIPAVALNFSQTGAGLKIQLDLLIDREFDPTILRRELLRAMLLEMSYRTLPSQPAGEAYNPPPDWLVDGILNFNNETPQLLDALESAAERPPPLQNFLALHPSLLDSQSRLLYRACADALLRMVLARPDGRPQLVRYIADWPRAAADAVANLQAHFPSVGKDEMEMERNWRASVARSATEQRFVLFNFVTTSQELDECLEEDIGQNPAGKSSLTLEQAARARRFKLDKEKARSLGQRLLLLSTHAHPLLRSIIVEYQRTVEALVRGQSHGLAKRLAANAELRQRVASRMREVDDYMNWFEATQSHKPSGTFRDYFRVAQTPDAATRRHDPLSVYLDAMETELQ